MLRVRLTPEQWGVLFLAVVALLFATLWRDLPAVGAFPADWNLGLRRPIDAFQLWAIQNRNTAPLFIHFFDPVSAALDAVLRLFERALLALPWPIAFGAVWLAALRVAGWRTAAVTVSSLAAIGLLGLWTAGMQTLALILVSVAVSLGLGIPIGVLTARSDRFEQALRPLLDAMQTLPAFVYLIPVLLFFGVARVPAVIATVIYALPPAIRLTNLGIRGVSAEAIEAARAFGSSERQILFKVQLPLAMPAVMAGVNQTIMMALGIVVIAALIGAGGLGNIVLVALRRLRVGDAAEAGLAIVCLAILLDRLTNTLNWRRRRRHSDGQALPFWQHYGYRIGGLVGVVVLLWLGRQVGWQSFPAAWQIDLSAPIDGAVAWMRDNLYEMGDGRWGAGPFSDAITLYCLNPLRRLLTEALPWPVVVLAAAGLALAVSGARLALTVALGMLGMGLLGMWALAMDTLSQVIVAAALAILLGLPLGIWSARSDPVEKALRPLLDFLQTIPTFVYLVPVIMLFNVGRVPGIIASVLYALPPVIRLTDLGIRQVDPSAVEAANSFGSTRVQLLGKVQLPLALPAIMQGINQTVMMVLAMVIIAGLVGGGGLGLEAVIGLTRGEMGRGFEAGLAIVLMAIVMDRMAQAWAARRARALNIGRAA